MKISIDIDCSPEEARTFFGLPDVKPIQEAMMSEVEERMKASLPSMDMEKLMKMRMPDGVQGMGDLQKAFWSQMTGAKNKE